MLDLPRPLLWADRAGSMPYIKGGGEAQLESLRALLELVRDDPANPDTIRAVDRARPRGFVERASRALWKVTDQGLSWLKTSDNAFLMGVFHSEIRFVGELLEQLESGSLTHGQLVQIAKSEYELPWNSMDQVRRRTTWFRAAGFLELRFDNYLDLTDSGQHLLHRLVNHPPKSVSQGSQPDPREVKLCEPHPAINKFLKSLDQQKLRNRRRLIGYMPGGTRGIEAVKSLMCAATPSISRDEWIKTCNTQFDISESSALQAIGSFRGVGLLKQISRDDESSTDLARAWLESDEDLDFVRLMHGNIRFFGELLSLMTTTGSVTELTARAAEFKISPPDLQRRIGLLMTAGLVEEVGVRRFRLTAEGEALIGELPLEDDSAITEKAASDETEEEVGGTIHTRSTLIADELRHAARAANDYRRFERAIAAALTELGFSVEHLGGQGRTDVRAVSPLPGEQRFMLIADAKASAKGQVVPFDVVTLREHKEQYGADYVIAIGERFLDKRTVSRAKTEGVGLLTVETLCQLLDLANSGDVGVADIKRVFAMSGSIPEDTAANAAMANKRLSSIAMSVLSALANEGASNDEVTKGALSSSELYVLLRNQTDSPSIEDIKVILELLSGPFVRGVVTKGEKYVLCEHVNIIAARLRSLASSFSAAAAKDSDAPQ